ncbi:MULTISPECIES: hypothetical protein [unclassified Crossiella]|uniref:hypothetical protein n=1 Tax=unclassified Crossiella TaxID=2620835 RepID=UPI001FFEA4E9|nr:MULTISPECIES: hypothetical protein [unclassified Crossiella]MCK2236468.1 hypothetical protein [Crossiella sp. S99.2]MCK2250135.1 hypothetical protein [Crossiella sp. S99.1]
MKRAAFATAVCGLTLGATGCLPSLPEQHGSTGQYTATVPRTAQFGQRYSWADGVSVEFSRPTPLRSPLIGPGRRGVQLTMTVSNGGSAPLRLPMTKLDGTFSERGTGRIVDAEPLVDKVGKIGISPDSPELPVGRSIHWQVGFSVSESAGTLLVAASPGQGAKYQDVTFAGEV